MVSRAGLLLVRTTPPRSCHRRAITFGRSRVTIAAYWGIAGAMADESDTTRARALARRSAIAEAHTRLTERHAELFDELAQRADEAARIAEHSAMVHDRLPSHVVNPPDHAERERMLAVAERAVAEAYRAHRLPSAELRAAIVRATRSSTSGPGGERSSPRREAESSPDA